VVASSFTRIGPALEGLDEGGFSFVADSAGNLTNAFGRPAQHLSGKIGRAVFLVGNLQATAVEMVFAGRLAGRTQTTEPPEGGRTKTQFSSVPDSRAIRTSSTA
jgi:hypothetical protein